MIKKPINRANIAVRNHPVLSSLMQEEAQKKLAKALIDIHQKFIDKVDDVNETIYKKVGPRGEKGEVGPKPRKGIDYFTDAEVRAMLDYIASQIVDLKDGKDGTNGKDGKTPQRGVDYMHEGDFENVVTRVIKRIKAPRDGKDAVIDIDAIVDQITNLPEGKLKFKTSHVDGLEQTLRALKSQVGERGYVHGGGDTVQAGSNITITRTSSGKTVISSTGGGGLSPQQKTSGTIDDSNTVFGFATQPTLVNVNGGFYQQTGGSITWTWNAGTSQVTLSSPVGTGGSIFAV